MATSSAFTPKASLTEAPTNLKEAIDWVLRVTGKDGKALNKETECICGLAAAVTDLLQSVELEYHGYEGDTKETDGKKGATETQVKEHLNELFSLVQGLGGTAVVRTYIDQLAQVLSALVGWSKIDKCWDKGSGDKCKVGTHGYQHGKDSSCEYLKDKEPNKPCEQCGCMKWEVKRPDQEGTPLGRKCKRCSDSGGSSTCKCSGTCSPGQQCQCALAGKCCKCCCKSCSTCKKDCICIEKEDNRGSNDRGHRIYKDTYQSAYGGLLSFESYVGGTNQAYRQPIWNDLSGILPGDKNIIGLLDGTASNRRHQCAQILLGSVCLIWSGLTYMYWTGKWAKGSPRWNNHILDGSGLDDGSLSQWLQALGFPRGMINNSGPRNRWDSVIWDGIRGMLYLGFPETGNGDTGHGGDYNDNTFRNPAGMNYAGYIHTVDRGAFCSNATIFHKNGTTSTTDENIHKCGALYKLYILSCAYFTGLQKRNSESTPRTPKTIREILYWLSALPYSQAYPMILTHSKEVLKKVAPEVENKKQLSFLQTGRSAPITVHEFNLFAHFQAVTQYCPLVLIGIQGGIHSTNSTTPAIHALYANTECQFTYPTVSIQAYNQVVHYIRALFYQLYFLRKQCAVKVTCGGKWRECRYGNGVIGKDVVSWMCLGCDPMEHDRKKRVGELKMGLDGLKTLSSGKSDDVAVKVKEVLQKIGDVVVQLGNAQEALEGKKKEAIEGVIKTLGNAKQELEGAKKGLEKDGLDGEELKKAKAKLDELTTNGGSSGALHKLANGNDAGSLQQIVGSGQEWQKDYSSAKDRISEAINGVYKALDLIKGWAKGEIEKQKKAKKDLEHVIKQEMSNEYTTLLNAINQLISICNTAQCPGCKDHAKKCGKPPVSRQCPTCHQQYMDGTPSPLQAFLEDRLPGFSCNVVRNTDTDKDTVYPPAASHLGHCNGSGQCCPLPMGFRNQFYSGSISDMTGARLYGILYFFSNENMMQSCVYTLVRVTAALSATTPQVLGDVFGFFRGGVGNKEQGEDKSKTCNHTEDPRTSTGNDKYFCGWCASGLRDVVKEIEWIYNGNSTPGGQYMDKVGKALVNIKGDKGSTVALKSTGSTTPSALSALTKDSEYLSPLTGELYTAVSATFGGTYLSWVLYLSDALQWGLESLASAFRNIECRGCKGQCDPNKCKKGEHGSNGGGQCGCQSIVSCTGVLPVLYRHGFSYGNPFNLEGYQQGDGKVDGQYDIKKEDKYIKQCHQFLDSLNQVIKTESTTPLHALLSAVGKLQYDIRLPWIFVLTLAWLVAVLYLAFGAIWPLDWTHMRSHWLRGGEHQWQCMWYKVMTGRKGMELVEYFGRR